MDVILLERVPKLGHMGEVVKVRDGYARNFLLRQGKALRATDANKTKFESERAALEARNAERRAAAGDEAKSLEGKSFILIRQAGESGQLYGSVTPRDIADAATAEGFTIDRKQIVLIRPIKDLGLHDVSVVLHAEVDTTIQINVARSPEEAELQAAGKSIQELAAEAEAAADFEIAELFDDIGAANEDGDEL